MPTKSTKSFRSEFGVFLREILNEQGLGVREGARILGDFDPGWLGGILSAKRPPPLAQLEAWADALKLRGEQRQEFLDLGYLTHCPDEVWTMVVALKAENKRLKQRLGAG